MMRCYQLTVNDEARGMGAQVARANLQKVFEGLSLGVFPTEQIVRCTEAITRLFPHHHLTFVHSKDDTEVFIHPRLTTEEQEQWDTAYEALFRRLGADR